jgi:predicted O-methyltransferase YrrM
LRLRPGARGRVGATLAAVRDVAQLWMLPRPVRSFYARALRTAARLRDGRAVRLATPPKDLASLLRLVSGRRRVVELGTAHAWTALSLVLADGEREVQTIDPTAWDTREAYLALVADDVRRRVRLFEGSGADAPVAAGEVDAVFVDTNHLYEIVKGAFEVWHGHLRPGGLMIFHDVDHPHFPDVARAIGDLGLDGVRRGGFYVWEKPAG